MKYIQYPVGTRQCRVPTRTMYLTYQKSAVILETHVDMLDCQRPAAAFYSGRELNNDPTNWFGPNPLAVKGMLESAGFRDIKVVNTSQASGTCARMVFHAWR